MKSQLKPGFDIEAKLEPRDLWIGIYWNYKNKGHFFGKWQRQFDLYICLIPMIPLHIRWHS